jgi:hypothetical protein
MGGILGYNVSKCGKNEDNLNFCSEIVSGCSLRIILSNSWTISPFWTDVTTILHAKICFCEDFENNYRPVRFIWMERKSHASFHCG